MRCLNFILPTLFLTTSAFAEPIPAFNGVAKPNEIPAELTERQVIIEQYCCRFSCRMCSISCDNNGCSSEGVSVESSPPKLCPKLTRFARCSAAAVP